jgi:hypothetical protein
MVRLHHRHLRKKDGLMEHTALLVCIISTPKKQKIPICKSSLRSFRNTKETTILINPSKTQIVLKQRRLRNSSVGYGEIAP